MTQFFCGAGPPPREDEEDAAVDTPDIGAAIPWVDDAERPPRRRRLVVGTFNTEWAFDGVGKESRVSPWSGADGSSCPDDGNDDDIDDDVDDDDEEDGSGILRFSSDTYDHL